MSWRGALARAWLVLALALPSAAQDWVADGKAVAVPVALKDALPAGGAWSRDTLKAVLARVLDDGKVSPEEAELLRELVSQVPAGPVAVGFADGSTRKVPRPTGDVLVQLRWLAGGDQDALWTGGPGEMRLLVDLASLHPMAGTLVHRFMMAKLAATWRTSSFTNGYAPFRDELARVVQLMQGAGDATWQPGRLLLFEASGDLDHRVRDAVPDFLYKWLKEDPAPN